VYHLETARLNAIIITGELEDGRGRVVLQAHPKDGRGYQMNTIAPTLAEAVQPVILTVERLLKEQAI